MTSSLENVLSQIEDLVEELVPEGRPEPLYRRHDQQKKVPGHGISLHRKFWFNYNSTQVVADRGQEMSEVEHSFDLRMHFDYQRYQARTFERVILSETTRVWRAIESNDIWGEGVRNVFVTGVSREDQDGGDVVMVVSLTSMVDETGGVLAINGEIPDGAVNGSNVTFVLDNQPRLSSLLVFKNGLAMERGVDYTISGQTITFDSTQVPQTGAVIWCKYQSM